MSVRSTTGEEGGLLVGGDLFVGKVDNERGVRRDCGLRVECAAVGADSVGGAVEGRVAKQGRTVALSQQVVTDEEGGAVVVCASSSRLLESIALAVRSTGAKRSTGGGGRCSSRICRG